MGVALFLFIYIKLEAWLEELGMGGYGSMDD